MNIVSLVGRLTADPEMKETPTGQTRTTINLAVARDFKNTNGVYETDFINCVLWNGIAAATKDYCHKGDVVGIKGRIQSRSYDTETGEHKYITEVIADKVIFITSVKTKKA